jgi:hypothetical protein
MDPPIPNHLKIEQQAVESQIREAFRGQTRAGGVSWTESVAIDCYESDENRAAARAKDTERRWEDLVEDPAWRDDRGIGGFNFLDPIGWAYYIAPVIIRSARRGFDDTLAFTLTIDNDFKRNLVSEINPTQALAIARFVRFMIATHKSVSHFIACADIWQRAYDMYWRQWEPEDIRR